VKRGWGWFMPVAVAALTFGAGCLPALAETAGAIHVHVVGLRNGNGVVRVALFDSSDSYSDDKGDGAKSFRKGVAEIKGREADLTFDAVPYGEYAIKLFHDEDGSGKFVTGMFGIPKVEFGFSNNAKGKLGPAKYADAKFRLESTDLNMNVEMQHVF